MLASIKTEDLDQLLNELEEAAHAHLAYPEFLVAVLQRLKFVLNARGTAVVISPTGHDWFVQERQGEIEDIPLTNAMVKCSDSKSYVWLGDLAVLAIAIGKHDWSQGAVCVAFDAASNLSRSAEILELCKAFAELIALRQSNDPLNQLEKNYFELQSSLEKLARVATRGEADCILVNDLVQTTGADRVSLFRCPQEVVVSGIITAQRKSSTVMAIRNICKTALKSDRCLLHNAPLSQDPEADRPNHENSPTAGLLQNYVCLPVFCGQADTKKSDACLLIEWNESESFMLGAGLLNATVRGPLTGWQHAHRILAIPKFLRNIFWGGYVLRSRVVASAARWGVVILLGLAGFWLLNLPTELRIEADGTLQPEVQREVYAPSDGVVSRILVLDGQKVQSGEILVELRSPELEINIQGVIGEMNAIAKKRDGLELAINQLTDERSDVIRQSQVSAEITELDTRLATLREKKAALQNEKEKLKVEAPIDGQVATREIERYLKSRPVRRGESLLRIVGFEGPWVLELLVADRDSGYLRKKLSIAKPATKAAASSPVDAFNFVIASRPDEVHVGTVCWVSDTARNPKGDGTYIDVIGSVRPEIAVQAHMGATVHAYFDCGQQPFWFVWSRPFIESIQRKLWF